LLAAAAADAASEMKHSSECYCAVKTERQDTANAASSVN